MPGFFASNSYTNVSLVNLYQDKCIQGRIEYNNSLFLRNTLNKFLEDKEFLETDESIIILDGYLLNKQQLFTKYCVNSIAELIFTLYQSKGECFFDEFRGVFSGVVYDKTCNKWIVFTNQVGDDPIFYVNKNGRFAIGSQVNYLIDFCRSDGIELTFNQSCAYQLLTYGYVATNETLVHEINRLRGGCYLVFENSLLEVKEYHRFIVNEKPLVDASEEEIIDKIDESFRKAVELEWEKDEEYGLRHIADLSGGLDSRMNIWVAHELKKRHALLLTYCRANYLDEIIAKEIAYYLKDEILFKQLDDATFMYDIDEITFLTGGLSIYSGITGGKRLLESLNLDLYGIEHTGMVGDVVLGSFFHSSMDVKTHKQTGMYSEKLRNRLDKGISDYQNEFANYEEYLIYTRGFHGAVNSHLIRKNFTEVGSPFLNVEFLQLCLNIPVELRINHYIYKKWILKKYPAAAIFKWEKINGKITESHTRSIFRKICKRVPQKLGRIFSKSKAINDGMNPIGYWIAHDDLLTEYMDSYENDAYRYLPTSVPKELINDLKMLYHTGSANEKAMVLTVLAAVKLFFGDNS